MTKWHDVLVQFAQGVALIKVVHVFVGLYFWEFVLNFDYEFSLITRKRKFNRTAPLYLACRWSTLCAMIMQLVAFDQSNGVNCEALLIMAFIFSYITFMSASCMIIARIYALWEQKTTIALITFAVFLGNTTAYIYNITITRARRVDSFCQVDHIVDIRITTISGLVTDIVLLSLMLFGVSRWKQARLMSGIFRIMYTQGLIYVVVITIADIPPVVFILLNFNLPMDQMFMVPAMIIQAVTAMRMYRGLIDSFAVNCPVVGVIGTDLKGLSTKSAIKFTDPSRLNRQEETTLGSGGTVPEPDYLVPSPQQFMMRQDDRSGSFGSQTV